MSIFAGLGVGVIYIDACLQLDLKRLTAIIDLHLTKRSQMAPSTSRGQNRSDSSGVGKKRVNTEQYIKACLKRLHLIQPTNSAQLILALERIHDSFLMSNHEIGLIILDTLNAFYWLERPVDDQRNVKFYESPKHKKICASLTEIVHTHKINLFVSLSNVFRGSGKPNDIPLKDDFWTNYEWRKLRTYKLRLSKRIVYQDKNPDGGGTSAGQTTSAGSAKVPPAQSQLTLERRSGQIPSQLLSYTLFKCSSKFVETCGDFVIRSAGLPQLQ